MRPLRWLYKTVPIIIIALDGALLRGSHQTKFAQLVNEGYRIQIPAA